MLGDVCATIAVSDIEKGKEFYGETLGLALDDEHPGGITYKSGNSRLFIYESEFAGTNKATYAGWKVDDIESVVADLKNKGVEFKHYPDLPDVTVNGDVHSWGSEMKAAWFVDPDGNILSLDSK